MSSCRWNLGTVKFVLFLCAVTGASVCTADDERMEPLEQGNPAFAIIRLDERYSDFEQVLQSWQTLPSGRRVCLMDYDVLGWISGDDALVLAPMELQKELPHNEAGIHSSVDEEARKVYLAAVNDEGAVAHTWRLANTKRVEWRDEYVERERRGFQVASEIRRTDEIGDRVLLVQQAPRESPSYLTIREAWRLVRDLGDGKRASVQGLLLDTYVDPATPTYLLAHIALEFARVPSWYKDQDPDQRVREAPYGIGEPIEVPLEWERPFREFSRQASEKATARLRELVEQDRLAEAETAYVTRLVYLIRQYMPFAMLSEDHGLDAAAAISDLKAVRAIWSERPQELPLREERLVERGGEIVRDVSFYPPRPSPAKRLADAAEESIEAIEKRLERQQ